MREITADAVYLKDDAEESVVSPPREARSTDATKITVPLPYMVTLIGLALAMAAGVWRIEGKVGQFETAMQYERQLDQQREKYLDQRFAALEAKIESAGLRNAAMAMSQQIDKQNGKH